MQTLAGASPHHPRPDTEQCWLNLDKVLPLHPLHWLTNSVGTICYHHQKVSTRIHQNCPREFTLFCPWEICHPKISTWRYLALEAKPLPTNAILMIVHQIFRPSATFPLLFLFLILSFFSGKICFVSAFKTPGSLLSVHLASAWIKVKDRWLISRRL